MAYATRGSRPLVVRGLSFRWRWRLNASQLSVWHVLDAGRLTVEWVQDAPRGAFVPTPAFVSRAVERALDAGWQTHLHHRMWLDPDTLAAIDGHRAGSRAIALPGVDNLLDHEASALRSPAFDSAALRDADVVLQLVFVPSFQSSSVLTLWTRREGAAHRGLAHLIAPVNGTRSEWLAEVDPDWVEDAVVSIRSAGPHTEQEGLTLDGLSVRLAVRDASGTLEVDARRPEPHSPVRVATLAGWRIAMQAFGGTEAARDVVEALHGHVQPGTLPLVTDPDDRVMRLFGSWDWPLGEALIEAFEQADGPWIVDARTLTGIAGATVDAVREHAARRRAPLYWVSNPDHPSPLEPLHRIETARARRTLAGRTAVQRAIARFDPRWLSVARDALLSPHPDRVVAGLRDLSRWLGADWTERTPNTPPSGWAYQASAGAWDWQDGLPAVGLLIGPQVTWARTADGCIFADR
jgi:hypothetical protein